MSRLYLDHQASTPMDGRVLDAMLSVGYGNPSSAEHSFGWDAAAKIDTAREQVASLIGADTDEIFFTSGATEANNLAILGLRKQRSIGKDHILRSAIEHKSVLAACEALSQEYGFEVGELAVDADGRISPDSVLQVVQDRTALVSISLVNNEIGVIQEIREIAKHRGRALLHSDAAQAPEAMDMSRTADVCDLISLSAHKMGGPMGIGALYISRAVQQMISPIVFGGGQQGGMRPGTLPVSLCVGMGVACEIAQSNGAQRERIAGLRDGFLAALQSGGLDFELNGIKDARFRHPGNANIRIFGVDAEQLLAMLQPKIAASTGSACTSGSLEASHVLTAIGLNLDEAASSIRFSLGRTTTENDILMASNLILDAASRTI